MATEPPQNVTETSGGNLCPTCAVISFNDELIASFIKTQDTREPCWDIIGAVERYPRHMHVHDATLGTYPLDYRIVDFLPSLPFLERSELRGCEFCSLLRFEIMQAEFDYTGYIEITLAYHLGQRWFPGLGVAALEAKLAWRPDIASVPPASPEPDILRSNIIFAIESDNANVASWLKIPRLRKEDPLCEDNIRFMNDELENCDLNCNHYRATGFLPSRLLDLGPPASLDLIRLIDSSQIVPNHETDRPRYAALSYCWGSPLASDGVEQARAKVGSVASMRWHVPQRGIPPVILDAIKVCKALSIRYLWVDSLCIIQDDLSDWEIESASMTLIYSNAFVTISTPSSTVSNQGFLVRHRRHVEVPFQSRVVRSINGHYNLVASGTCHDLSLYGWPDLDVFQTPWAGRGWTLQEVEMSNRLLIFGKSMTHFQCRHIVSDNGYRQDDSMFSRMVYLLDDRNSDLRISPLYWERILESYGKRVFTFIEDKLPGISGMAKCIAEKNGDEYLAGLWKTGLPSSLLWYPSHHRTTKYHVELEDLLEWLRSPTPYIVPSWSPVRLDVGVNQEIYSDTESTLVTASAISVGKNPFGRVAYGRIRIQGRVMQVFSDLAMLRCYDYPYLWCNRNRGVITYYRLDWVSAGEICNRGELFILLIASAKGRPLPHAHNHGGSLEAAQHCCTKYLDDSINSSLMSAESQADQHSREADFKSDLSLSRSLAIVRSTEEFETEGHIQAISEGEDKSVESDPDPSGSRAGSEERPRSSNVNNRDASGLLVHPLSGTDTYVRVGVWISLVGDGGGTALFDDVGVREIDIV